MQTTTLAPSDDEGTVYLVLEDFGRLGRAYRETDPSGADRQTAVADLLSGQYQRPMQIVAFNAAEGWARDVTAEMAQEVLARAKGSAHDLPAALSEFLERVA